MKRALLCLVIMSCAVRFAVADETVRSLQQNLKDQGFYYGTVTGDKNAETTAAIRRYQIRNGLQVTGELNDETLRSVKSSSNSVATAPQPNSKSAVAQSNSVPPDANTPLTQSSPTPSYDETNRPLKTNPSYSASFYQRVPFRANRRTIAGAQSQLMSRGYYRGRIDGRYGSETAFAVRAFQSRAGLPATGRLDMQTLEALGSSDTNFVYLAPVPRGYETWMPVRKFKNGKWKMKWKRYYRSFAGQDGDEGRPENSQPEWSPYNRDY